jgi:hypothetical protein
MFVPMFPMAEVLLQVFPQILRLIAGLRPPQAGLFARIRPC